MFGAMAPSKKGQTVASSRNPETLEGSYLTGLVENQESRVLEQSCKGHVYFLGL